jgi:type IV pilus assembly protein PilM
VPLSAVEVDFDVVPVGERARGEQRLAGIALPQRIVDETLAVFDEAGIEVRALEGEAFSLARALIDRGNDATVLLIDIGKTTTKIAIVTRGIPRFSATIGIGGHALTLAIQKHVGVTESDARRVKAERGILLAGDEEYRTALLSTVSAIRTEVARRLEYWQERAAATGHERVSRAILAGGNASVRGLPEYLADAFKLPVLVGEVFTGLASRDHWVPALPRSESLAYATAIGLALRDRD